MSENAFTYGNLILLYSKFTPESSESKSKDLGKDTEVIYDNLPDFVKARIALCIETFDIIMKSKPDKYHINVVLVSESNYGLMIKEHLNQKGISSQYVELDNNSKSIEAVLNNVLNRISTLSNPPAIYFIGSVWQKEVFDSIVISKFKNKFKITFEGSLDHRPYDLIQRDKLTEEPKKGTEYYKQKVKNKAIDSLLNYIFSNKKK